MAINKKYHDSIKAAIISVVGWDAKIKEEGKHADGGLDSISVNIDKSLSGTDLMRLMDAPASFSIKRSGAGIKASYF